ncbi:MAG: transposase [Candidatus Cyclobacteriaceae bacterium M2_1C_046]
MQAIPERRKSTMELGEVYFWTSSIYQWDHLLKERSYKDLILQSLSFLVAKNKIAVYAFVIMPNHIHLIWELLTLNGKEKPNASFHKYTAHKFQEELKKYDNDLLKRFKVKEPERKYRFWNRDPLATLMYSKEIVEQKLDYIHLNPLQEHWNLVKSPEEYYFSSAAFYEADRNNFPFLTDYRERF